MEWPIRIKLLKLLCPVGFGHARSDANQTQIDEFQTVLSRHKFPNENEVKLNYSNQKFSVFILYCQLAVSENCFLPLSDLTVGFTISKFKIIFAFCRISTLIFFWILKTDWSSHTPFYIKNRYITYGWVWSDPISFAGIGWMRLKSKKLVRIIYTKF